MTFGEKLKQLRIQNELSQEALAEHLHVSRQAVTKWESDRGLPDLENLRAIAQQFDVTLDSLLDETEEVETTEENFYWETGLSGFVIGLVLGWLLQDTLGANMGTWAMGGAVIGCAAGHLALLIKRKH